MTKEVKQPYYNARAAALLALCAGAVAGVVTYLVNGQDAARAAMAATLWVVIGWYSGKTIFPRADHYPKS
jgi:hypothetical protein